METINKAMSLVVILTLIIITFTIWNNSQTKELPNPGQKEFVDTFLFEPPLVKMVVSYSNPGQKELQVIEKDNYRGTKISLGEYDFKLRGNISNVTYQFDFPEKMIKENDVNPDSIEIYTILNEEFVKAGGEKNNNSINLTTTKLVPILILADANEVEEISEEEIFYNSRSDAAIFYEAISNFFGDTKNNIIGIGIFIGILMTLVLVKIERNRFPKVGMSDKNIEEFIKHFRSEGMSNEEILAILIERGIKASHAEMLVKRKH